MGRPASKHPTELELEILNALWDLGPRTIKQLQEALAPKRELAYTTIVTMLTIMVSKGFVAKKPAGSGHLYEAAIARGEAAGGMLRDLINRAYGGSTLAVVQQLLNASEIDSSELEQIRKLINRKAKEQSQP